MTNDMSKDLARLPQQIERNLPDNIREFSWTRSLAAGSLVTGAVLLLTGRRRGAVAVAIAGTAVALFENPDGVREFWRKLPDYIRTGQDFFSKAERLIEQIGEQGERFRAMSGH